MMESTITKDKHGLHGGAKLRGADVGNAPAVLLDAGRHEVSNLLADVQDLLGRVAHVADPEIALLRTRVENGLAATKGALLDAGHQIQRRAKSTVNAGDHYVRDRPWQAVGVAAAAGLVVGVLVARR